MFKIEQYYTWAQIKGWAKERTRFYETEKNFKKYLAQFTKTIKGLDTSKSRITGKIAGFKMTPEGWEIVESYNWNK